MEAVEKFERLALKEGKLNNVGSEMRVKLMSQCVNLVKDNNPKLARLQTLIHNPNALGSCCLP